MRRAVSAGVLATAALLVPVLATPAAAGPDLVHVYSSDAGTGVGVGDEAHPIAGAGVSTYYGVQACVVVGFSTTCTPEITP
ncbi:MAG TPA: hypothetical protein VNA14_13125 [Mycobacteriales bacterium]|nr:hypothetical protein [Mycobacteriales bacterium]